MHQDQERKKKAVCLSEQASTDGESDFSDPSVPAVEIKKQNSKSQETSSTFTAQISSIYRYVTSSSPSRPEQNKQPEATNLQDIITKKEDELRKLKESFAKLETKLEFTEESLGTVRFRLASQTKRHDGKIHDLKLLIEQYKSSLKSSSDTIKDFELKIAEYEAQLKKAYSNTVSNWAQDVSRDMPDDMIRSTITSFFQGDFFSWCADMCATDIQWETAHENTLHWYGLINQSPYYLSAPPHLQFSCSAPDGCSSLVLLQTALAKSLTSAFLTNPYFLLDDGTIFRRFEEALAKKSLDAAVNWRTNTVRSLQRTYPLHSAQVKVHVHHFLTTFGFLLQELDNPAVEDLEDLFQQFSRIALQLWQAPTRVRVLGLAHMSDWAFTMNYPYAECEPVVAAALGEELNGRPVGVVIRPAILSDPIPEPGKHMPPVVWSKALVWVSGERDPYETGDEIKSSP